MDAWDEAIGWGMILLGVVIVLAAAAGFEAVVTRWRQ